MNSTYILKKDLPDCKVGAEFSFGNEGDVYFLSSDKTGTGYNCYAYPKEFVENNTDWFQLKKEPLFLAWKDKPVYEGDTIWGCDKESNKVVCHPARIRMEIFEDFVYFASEDDFNEYIAIEKNKPCHYTSTLGNHITRNYDFGFYDFQIKSRPPLGITPNIILNQKRINEITEAINRYVSASKEIPSEWMAELSSLISNNNKKE